MYLCECVESEKCFSFENRFFQHFSAYYKLQIEMEREREREKRERKREVEIRADKRVEKEEKCQERKKCI